MKPQKRGIFWTLLATLLCALMMPAASAPAADVSLGLGLGLTPDYEGSEDYEGVLIPYASVVWSNHMAFDLIGNKAKFNLIPSANWKGGLVGEFIPERDDVDSNKVDKLDDVDTSIMLGGFFGWENPSWTASIEAMADVADGNDGAIIRLNGGHRLMINNEWRMGFGAFVTWADEDYTESYFGISLAESARSGLNDYDADEGFKDVGLNFRVIYQPWQHWGFMGLASYKRLVGDAADSPVVEDEGSENQLTGGVLVFYKF
jgi:outer membrane protein